MNDCLITRSSALLKTAQRGSTCEMDGYDHSTRNNPAGTGMEWAGMT